jgi:hypothetical protein
MVRKRPSEPATGGRDIRTRHNFINDGKGPLKI